MENDKIAALTGGVGFIGYHLSKVLITKGYDVHIYDNFSDFYSPETKWRNASELIDLGANIIEGDLLDRKLLTKWLKRINKTNSITPIVFHLAAQAGIRYCEIHPEKAYKINVIWTLNVLDSMLRNKIPYLVFSSSSTIFGETQYLPINENHPKNPISVYGKSKLNCEKAIIQFNEKYEDLNYTIIQPFSVVGPRQRPDMALHIFIRRLMNNKAIQIYGDGNNSRDWTHVKDTAYAFYLAGENNKLSNLEINIGSGKNYTLKYTIEKIANLLGKEPKIEYLKRNAYDVYNSCADISFAKKILGYKVNYQLENAIKDMINYFPK